MYFHFSKGAELGRRLKYKRTNLKEEGDDEMEDLKNMSVEDIVNKCRPRRRVENSISKKEKKVYLKELISRGKTGEVKASMLRDILMELLPPAPQGRKEIENLQIELAKLTIPKYKNVDVPDEFKEWAHNSDEALIKLFALAMLSPNVTGCKELAKALCWHIFHRELQEQVSSSEFYVYIRQQVPQTDNPLFYKKVEQMLRKIIEAA